MGKRKQQQVKIHLDGVDQHVRVSEEVAEKYTRWYGDFIVKLLQTDNDSDRFDVLMDILCKISDDAAGFDSGVDGSIRDLEILVRYYILHTIQEKVVNPRIRKIMEGMPEQALRLTDDRAWVRELAKLRDYRQFLRNPEEYVRGGYGNLYKKTC